LQLAEWDEAKAA